MTARVKSEAQKAAQRRYNASPKGRAGRARWAKTEAGRELRANCHRIRTVERWHA